MAGILSLTNSNSLLNFQIPSIRVKLDRDNYVLWKTDIVSTLETFDLESHIINPKPPPETQVVPAIETTPTSTEPNPEFTTWKKRDRYVLLWLKSRLSERSLALVSRSTTSQMAWVVIEKTFKSQTGARRMAMQTQLQPLPKGSLSMMEYIEKKRPISDSLAKDLNPIYDGP